MADTSTQLLQLIGADNKLFVLDEAQQIPDMGGKLKLIYDTSSQHGGGHPF